MSGQMVRFPEKKPPARSIFKICLGIHASDEISWTSTSHWGPPKIIHYQVDHRDSQEDAYERRCTAEFMESVWGVTSQVPKLFRRPRGIARRWLSVKQVLAGILIQIQESIEH